MRDLGWLALACCALFVLAGLVFVPRVGIQYDEALFAGGIYPPIQLEYQAGAPLMLMKYLGALKIWLYRPILAVFGPSAYSLRVPMLLAGAATAWLFFVLLRRLLDKGAALAGCLLLTTDACFLLTTCLDWGPVALQHLLLVGGLAAGLQAHRTGRALWGAAAGLCFGLALWDKAVFLWVLVGLAAGALAVYPREAWRVLRRGWLAAAGFLVGAAPLLVYNLSSGWGTLVESKGLSLEGLGVKLAYLRWALDGSALFGYVIRDGPARPDTVAGPLGQLSILLSDLFGRPQSSLQVWAVAAAALAAPLLRGPLRRLALFVLTAAGTAILLMLATAGGGAVHHFLLLWPLPHFLAAIALARWQRFRAGLVATLCFSNLLVTNQYLKQWREHGPTPAWSDAVYELARRVEALKPAQVFVADWGISEPLRFLGGGRLPLIAASDGVVNELAPGGDHIRLATAIASPDTLFIGYTDGNETFSGVNAKLRDYARRRHLRKEMLETIWDRHQRPIYELFRFERAR